MAQVLNFFIYLFLAKIYGPANFGVFGLFTALFFVLAELVNAKIDQSIMLPKNEYEAMALTRLSMIIGLGVALFVFLILIFLHLVNLSIIQGLRWKELILLPICLLLFGIWQSLQVYCNRQEKYKTLSIARVIQVVVTGIFSYLFFQNNLQLNGLILGFVFGWAASIAVLMFPTIQSLFFLADSKSISNKQLLNRYSDFPKYGSWSALVNTLSRYLPYYFLMPGFGSVLTGQYTLAHKILSAPVGIIGGAIGQVFFKEASTKNDNGIFLLAKQLIKRNILIAILPTLVVLFFGETLFEMIFGVEWQTAGRVSQFLVLWIFMTFISGPISTVIDLKEELKWELIYNVFFLIFRVIALFIGVYYRQFFLAIGCYVFVGILFNLIFLWKMNRLLIKS